MNSLVRISMWNCNSSVSGSSSLFFLSEPSSRLIHDMVALPSGEAQHLRHRPRQPIPVLLFLGELLASDSRKPVVLRSAVVFGRAPLGADPAGLLDAVQRWV